MADATKDFKTYFSERTSFSLAIDADSLLIYDSTGALVKRILLSNLYAYLLTKLKAITVSTAIDPDEYLITLNDEKTDFRLKKIAYILNSIKDLTPLNSTTMQQSDDSLAIIDYTASALKLISGSDLQSVLKLRDDSWHSIRGVDAALPTVSYNAAFVMNINDTSYLSTRMKIKLTNASATKYYQIVSIVTDTSITLVGDTALANSAITNVYYSMAENPYGWTYKNTISGAGAPATTPFFVGQYYIDTTADTLYFATGIASSADWIACASATPTTVTVVNVSADYTILDTLASDAKLLVSPNSGAQKGLITVTLPTLADNIGKEYEVIFKTGQGLIKVDGEGAETINYKGDSLTTVLLYSKGSSYKFLNNGTEWVVSGTNKLNTNWISRSDWTNVHLGNAVTYDNGSGGSTKNTDWTGMVITEATSGFNAVVIEDTGGTGTTGILYFMQTNGGFTAWTNNRVLTASNGQTIDVNEATGPSSKNIDYNLFHDFGANKNKLDCQLIINATASFTDAIEIDSFFTYESGTTLGHTIFNKSASAILIQTAAQGLVYHSDAAGSGVVVDTEDWFYNLSLDFSC